VTLLQLVFQSFANLIELLESGLVSTMSEVAAYLVEDLERHIPEASHNIVLILFTMEKCT
jgi:hypothetical protein